MQIAYLQGGRRTEVQSVLWNFSQRMIAAGHRLAGMVERHDRIIFNDKRDTLLTGVADGAVCPLFQDLGSQSQACSLDVPSITEAAGLVEASISPGVALLVISKFGKVEAEGGGFRNAMGQALALGIPVLTSVNPVFQPAWEAFTCGLSQRLGPEQDGLQAWWSACSHEAREPVFEG